LERIMTETGTPMPNTEPPESDLPDKPPVPDVPEDPSVPGEEPVPDEDFQNPQEADADPETDNTEQEQ
jgi:hypothetical protein